MMKPSKIEWYDINWNPVTGCKKTAHSVQDWTDSNIFREISGSI